MQMNLGHIKILAVPKIPGQKKIIVSSCYGYSLILFVGMAMLNSCEMNGLTAAVLFFEKYNKYSQCNSNKSYHFALNRGEWIAEVPPNANLCLRNAQAVYVFAGATTGRMQH